MPKKKNTTRRMQADVGHTDVVMTCPLCQWRAATMGGPTAAWKLLYRHLRSSHDSQHAAQLTEQARKNLVRLNWQNKKKEAPPQ